MLNLKKMIKIMEKKNLWYDLLTTGKKKLGWKYGLSIPFIVGAYSRKREKNYGSLTGLKEIFNEILATIEEDKIAIIKCPKYKTIDVYILQILSEIPESIAKIAMENPVYKSKIYTTILGESSLDDLIEKLWDMYKETIAEGNFSAQDGLQGDHWRCFNSEEISMIDQL